MKRLLLHDDTWERILDFILGKAGDRGVAAKDNRRFAAAVLWIAQRSDDQNSRLGRGVGYFGLL